MPRDYEIMMAFKQAMKRDALGRFTISTLDFVGELERLNWHYTLRSANSWIEMRVVDGLNQSGKGKLWFAGQGIQKSWEMKREMLSPAYTTRLSDLPVAK